MTLTLTIKVKVTSFSLKLELCFDNLKLSDKLKKTGDLDLDLQAQIGALNLQNICFKLLN